MFESEEVLNLMKVYKNLIEVYENDINTLKKLLEMNKYKLFPIARKEFVGMYFTETYDINKNKNKILCEIKLNGSCVIVRDVILNELNFESVKKLIDEFDILKYSDTKDGTSTRGNKHKIMTQNNEGVLRVLEILVNALDIDEVCHL